MEPIHVSVFGRFAARYSGDHIAGLRSSKVQELFCYLLLHRDKPHPREALASLFWGNYCTTARSKKYLRNALWQLQRALSAQTEPVADRLLEVESEWIQLHTIDELWLDAAILDETYGTIVDSPGGELTEESACTLERVIQLYTGDLLSGWYQDWCLHERERFLHMYLVMLDKLMGYCETVGEPERGIAYGERILQRDRARERTHCQMMRLYCAAGDRTGALRQYDRCVKALKEELDAPPARSTVELYERIQNDRLELSSGSLTGDGAGTSEMRAIVGRLRRLEENLVDPQEQVHEAARVVSLSLEEGDQTLIPESSSDNASELSG